MRPPSPKPPTRLRTARKTSMIGVRSWHGWWCGDLLLALLLLASYDDFFAFFSLATLPFLPRASLLLGSSWPRRPPCLPASSASSHPPRPL